jgi:hypothetical protein
MNRTKMPGSKLLMTAVGTAAIGAAALLSTPASAGGNVGWSVSVGGPGFAVTAGQPGSRYYGAPYRPYYKPHYYRPAPVYRPYYRPYYAPRPVYYAPPVVYTQPYSYYPAPVVPVPY